ncbi:MAG: hypothetical protein U9N41_07265 [Euryarchaeota archaeon]|nr:hypothetical protein [Euryarchaeota archaeon]
MELSSFNFISSASQISIILAFAIIGAGLKYIDDAFDEEMFSKRIAMLIAPILVIIWTCLAISDSVSATILFSILFAVLLAGKIDNLVFKASSLALILILVLSGMLNFLWIPLFTLTMMGVADERGNDYVDNHVTHKLGQSFFSHRCCMKIGVLGLCMFSWLPWLYLGAFLAFDGAYESIRIFSKISIENRRGTKEKNKLLTQINTD